MNEAKFSEIVAWLAEAGLGAGTELEVITGFCERATAAGMPLGRAHVILDTLHPTHEGSLFRWGMAGDAPSLLEYGERGLGTDGLAAAPPPSDQWKLSPFFHMDERGERFFRRRLTGEDDEFTLFPDLRADGVTDYIAIVSAIAPAAAVGEMDSVYSSWMSRDPGGFSDADQQALRRFAPFIALAIKSAALTRTARTLMTTYLGRDPARRVLSGTIVRGVSDRIDAVLWFSDLRGFTRITDTSPEQVIPLLNDYADVVVSAVHDHGGDVLKLIGDGTLAIFNSGDRTRSCHDALEAVIAARSEIARLNERRSALHRPVTDIYIGLHVGEVFYGNIGSRERLDFTVIGPAVNETARIAAMCRSVDQPVLVSAAFAGVDDLRDRLVSVGRYALRGVGKPQELFTLDPERAGNA